MKYRSLLVTALAFLMTSCGSVIGEADNVPEQSSAVTTTTVTSPAAAEADVGLPPETTTAPVTTTAETSAATEVTTTTPVTTTTAPVTPASTTTTAAPAPVFKSVSGKTVYAVGWVTFRTEPDEDSLIIRYIEENEAVTVLGESEDGKWLNIRYDGMDGYAAASGTTEKAPATTTTRPTATTAPAVTSSAEDVRDQRLAAFVARVTAGKEDKLRACYDAIVNNFGYSTQPYPVKTEGWEKICADNMLVRGSGTCYEFASLMQRCAVYLGYDVRCVDNNVRTYFGNLSHHCWTELHKDGKVYVIDPETYYEVLYGVLNVIHRCDFYMIEYSQVPYPMCYYP